MPLDEGAPLEQGRQRRVLTRKKRYFAAIGLPSVKTVADRYKQVGYYDKHWTWAFLVLSASI